MLNEKLQSILVELKNDNKIFLNFFKSKYRLYHNSNLFRKDFEYALMRYLEMKGKTLNFSENEKLSFEFSKYYEEEKIFIKINDNAWRLEYPEFVTAQPQLETV